MKLRSAKGITFLLAVSMILLCGVYVQAQDGSTTLLNEIFGPTGPISSTWYNGYTAAPTNGESGTPGIAINPSANPYTFITTTAKAAALTFWYKTTGTVSFWCNSRIIGTYGPSPSGETTSSILLTPVICGTTDAAFSTTTLTFVSSVNSSYLDNVKVVTVVATPTPTATPTPAPTATPTSTCVSCSCDYAVYMKELPSGSVGETLSASSWNVRNITATVIEKGSSISRDGNNITLQPGAYYIQVMANCYSQNWTKLRLRTSDNSTTLAFALANNDQLMTYLIVPTVTTFRIEQFFMGIGSEGSSQYSNDNESQRVLTVQIQRVQ
jgi:hypothetical protein